MLIIFKNDYHNVKRNFHFFNIRILLMNLSPSQRVSLCEILNVYIFISKVTNL